MDTDQPLQDQALDHVRELLATHWREAKDSTDEDGKFAIGLRISVLNGAPAKLKVKCSISKTITDEIESQVDDPEQMKLLLGQIRGGQKQQ